MSPTTSRASISPKSKRVRLSFEFRGGNARVFEEQADEVLVDGPAGTGKSLACLMKVHLVLSKYSGARGLLVRKTQESLKSSGLVTYQKFVLHDATGIRFFGGNAQEPPQYRYPNGSRLMLGGMDKAKKVMSTEYDIIFAQEATEFTVDDWESFTTRTRNGTVPYNQIIADCNPDRPEHWLNRRCERGDTVRLLSRHEDNPAYYDIERRAWTPAGVVYMRKLNRLTGVRKLRLKDGQWVSAEGQVYESYDDAIHGIDEDSLPTLRSFFAAQDWGYTNPGVMGVFGEDGDGRLYLVAQLYMTQKTMDWWIPEAKALHREYNLGTIQCDPSEPGYIKQYRDAGLPAVAGYNRIPPGVGAVQQRLQVAGDGLPRLRFLRTALRHADDTLIDDELPFSTAQEFAGFVWPKDASGKVVKETPAPGIDHGMDMLRYAVAYRDLHGRPTPGAPIDLPSVSKWAETMSASAWHDR